MRIDSFLRIPIITKNLMEFDAKSLSLVAKNREFCRFFCEIIMYLGKKVAQLKNINHGKSSYFNN